MMSHDAFEEMLARRPELNPAEIARLETHLRDCSDCRATAEAYARQIELLRALPLVAPPPSLRAGVLAEIHRPRRRMLPLRLAAFAPLAVVLLVAAALAYSHRPNAGGSKSAAAPTAHSTTTFGTNRVAGTAGSRRRSGKHGANSSGRRSTHRPVHHHSTRHSTSHPGQSAEAPVVAQQVPPAPPPQAQPTAATGGGVALGAQQPPPSAPGSQHPSKTVPSRHHPSPVSGTRPPAAPSRPTSVPSKPPSPLPVPSTPPGTITAAPATSPVPQPSPPIIAMPVGSPTPSPTP